MCGLTKASTRVVTARSYSRYSGSTAQESESVQSGYSSCDDLGDAALVRGIGIGMDQADADRAHPVAAEKLRGGAHAGLVERAQLLPAKIEPAADLAHEIERHERSGFTQK